MRPAHGRLTSNRIDAVFSLSLNVFYGAGVPACLLILRKERPAERRDRLLLVYAARHYRELANQNELRPQDVMRIEQLKHSLMHDLLTSKVRVNGDIFSA